MSSHSERRLQTVETQLLLGERSSDSTSSKNRNERGQRVTSPHLGRRDHSRVRLLNCKRTQVSQWHSAVTIDCLNGYDF